MAKELCISHSALETNREIELQNGDLIVLKESDRVYMVTDYSSSASSCRYCTFISIISGRRLFREPCSRITSMGRIWSHIRNICPNVVDSRQIEIVPCDNYKLSIDISGGTI